MSMPARRLSPDDPRVVEALDDISGAVQALVRRRLEKQAARNRKGADQDPSIPIGATERRQQL